MSRIAVAQVTLDAAGHLRVYPRPTGIDFAFIYRDASSVRWDAADRSLYVLPVDNFSTVDEFRQIIRAVRNEYGDVLFIDRLTHFAVRPELVAQLQTATQEH